MTASFCGKRNDRYTSDTTDGSVVLWKRNDRYPTTVTDTIVGSVVFVENEITEIYNGDTTDGSVVLWKTTAIA